MEINKFIDHTLLLPTATESDIIKLCIEAKEYNFHTVCVNGSYIPLAAQMLKNSGIKLCAAIGYPFGASTTESKIFEAKEAVQHGAQEIDMVVNIGFLKSRNHIALLKDIADLKLAIGRHTLKATIEISELSKNEIIRASEICLDAKADFIKTSSGFSKSGATLTAVKIIKRTVREAAKVIASGGITDYETALRYVQVGVERLGTSHGVEIFCQKEQESISRLQID